MPKLLVYFLPMHSKDFYLTLNIIDIIMGIIFTGIFESSLIIRVHSYYDSWVWILDLILLVTAIFALCKYFMKRYYRTSAHFAYMITRIFSSVLKFLFTVMILYACIVRMADNKHRSKYTPSLVYFSFMTCYSTLSLYWSYHLMRIVN